MNDQKDPNWCPLCHAGEDDKVCVSCERRMEAAIRAAVREEREACAAIAETHPLAPDTTTGTRQRWLRDAIAGAIRREVAK